MSLRSYPLPTVIHFRLITKLLDNSTHYLLQQYAVISEKNQVFRVPSTVCGWQEAGMTSVQGDTRTGSRRKKKKPNTIRVCK